MSLFKNSVALLYRQIISGGLNLVSIAVASYYLDFESFSFFAIIVPFIALMTMFIDLGYSVNLTTMNEIPNKGQVNSLFVLKIFLSFFVFVLVVLSLSFFGIKIDPYMLLVLYIISVFRALRLQIEAYFQRELNWTLVAKNQIFEVVVYNFSFILFLVLMKSYWAMIYALLIREVFVIFLYGFYGNVKVWCRSGFCKVSNSSVLFGVTYQASGFLGVINTFSNVFIGNLNLTAFDIGRINWASQIASISRAPFQYLPILLLTHLSSDVRNKVSVKGKIIKSYFFSSFLVLVISLLVLAFCVAFTPLLKEEWRGSVFLLSIYIFENLKFVQSNIINNESLSRRDSKKWLKTNLVNTISIYVFCYIGSVFHGAEGFVFGMVLSSMLTIFFQMIISGDFKVYFPVTASCFIISIIGIGATFPDERYISLLILIFDFILFYFVFLFFFRRYMGFSFLKSYQYLKTKRRLI